MTKEQREQLARERFIDEVRSLNRRVGIHEAVEIIRRLDLNPRRDKAMYDSDARLAREWIAYDVDPETGERRIHNVKRTNERGEAVQEFVQEDLFDVEDYRIKAEDETKVLKHAYRKVKHFVDNCFERYGVRLKVDLSFMKPFGRPPANRATKPAKQPRLDDTLNTD